MEEKEEEKTHSLEKNFGFDARVLFFSVLKIYFSKTDLKKEKSLFSF